MERQNTRLPTAVSFKKQRPCVHGRLKQESATRKQIDFVVTRTDRTPGLVYLFENLLLFWLATVLCICPVIHGIDKMSLTVCCLLNPRVKQLYRFQGTEPKQAQYNTTLADRHGAC
jgi:hypothetical protein